MKGLPSKKHLLECAQYLSALSPEEADAVCKPYTSVVEGKRIH